MRNKIMKLIMVMFFLCITIGNIFAETVDLHTAEDRVKAIVAYELNSLSLSDNKDAEEFNANPKELESASSVKEILEAIKDFGKNVSFTKEIDNVASDFQGKEDLASFFTNEVYQLDGIKSLLSKRDEKDVESTKIRIKKAIDSYLQSIEISSLVVETAESDVINEVSSSAGNNNGITVSMQSNRLNPDGSVDSNNYLIHQGYIGFITAVLCFVFAILAGVFFFKYKKTHEKNKLFFREVEEKSHILSAIESERTQLKREIERKNSEIRLLKDEIETLEVRLDAASTRHVESVRQPSTPVFSQPKADLSVDCYVGSPRGGIFAGGFDSYRPGKSLFKIHSDNGHIGEYEFISRPESIQIVQQSKSAFLEPACNILNEVNSFSQVTTVSSGKVERVEDGWKIIRKADIHLA